MMWIAQKIEGNIEYPQLWTATRLLVKIASPISPLWKKAGYLRIDLLIEGEYFTVDRRSIEFGNNLVELPVTNYRLAFEPVPALIFTYPNTIISIYPLSTVQTQEFYMGVNFSPRQPKDARLVEQQINFSTASQSALSGDAYRAEGSIIYNKTNADLFVKLGFEEATTGDILVPAGSNYELPATYMGGVQMLSASNVLTGYILVQSLTYSDPPPSPQY